MKLDSLLQMANAIGQFFDAMPDRDEAVEGVATHLKRYWEPRMREQLLARAAEGGIDGLHPLVAAALQARREALMPARR